MRAGRFLVTIYSKFTGFVGATSGEFVGLKRFFKSHSFSVFKALLLLIVLYLLADTAVAQQTVDAAPPQYELRIGVSLPLSGPLVDLGAAVRVGIEAAQEKFKNDARVSFIFQDNRYQASTSLSVFRSLVEVEGVGALISVGAPPTLAVASQVERRRVPTIALTAASSMDDGKGQMVLRVWESANELSYQVSRLADLLGSERVVVVSTLNDANITIKTRVEELLGSRILLTEDVLPEESNFRDIALRIKGSQADLVFSNLLSGAHIHLLKRLQELKVKISVVTQSSIFFDSQVRMPYPAILSGVFFTAPDDRGAQEFYTGLRERGKGEQAVYMAAIAYDVATYIYQAFTVGGWRPPQPIPNRDFRGLLGEYQRIAGGRAFEPPANLFRFVSGEEIGIELVVNTALLQ